MEMEPGHCGDQRCICARCANRPTCDDCRMYGSLLCYAAVEAGIVDKQDCSGFKPPQEGVENND